MFWGVVESPVFNATNARRSSNTDAGCRAVAGRGKEITCPQRNFKNVSISGSLSVLYLLQMFMILFRNTMLLYLLLYNFETAYATSCFSAYRTPLYVKFRRRLPRRTAGEGTHVCVRRVRAARDVHERTGRRVHVRRRAICARQSLRFREALPETDEVRFQ